MALPDTTLTASFRTVSRTAALVVALVQIALSSSHASGAFGSSPDALISAASTALFVLLALALWLAAEPDRPRLRVASGIAAGFVALVAAVALGAQVLGLMLSGPADPSAAVANSIVRVSNHAAPNLTGSFLLMGLALLSLDSRSWLRHRLAQYFTVAASLISLLALIGYFYRFEPFYRVGPNAAMPLGAALCFIALASGILCARPEHGLMRIVASETSGGFLMRWLPAAVFGVPLLFGWLTMAGQRAGFYSLEFGISVFVILNTIFFSMLVLWTAASLDRADGRRNSAEAELRIRALQQAAVAELSQRALSGLDLPTLQKDAVDVVVSTLQVDFSELLELSSDGRLMIRSASSGSLIAACEPTVSTSAYAMPGYTLAGRQPVVVDDLKSDSRFTDRLPECMADVVSGISVIVHGRTGPSGVLAAYSRTRRVFTKDDILFLQTMSAVLATADDRQHADEALRSSEEKFASAFRSCPDSMIVSTLAEGRFMDVNESFLRITGYGSEEVVGRTAAELSFWAEPDTWKRIGQEALEHGTISNWEASFLTKVGESRFASISAEVITLSDEQCLLTVVRDISEGKRAQREMEDAHHKLASSVYELESRAREMSLLTEMGDLLQSCFTAAEAYGIVIQYAKQLFPDESGALCMLNRTGDLLEPAAVWGDFPGADALFTPNECWALRRGRLHRITEPESSLACAHVSRPLPPAYLCVPMMAQGEALGLLHLRESTPVEDGSHELPELRAESRVRLAATVAEHIALALANLKLRETLRTQSIRDQLTGLYNRRHMEESLERELRRASRTGRSIGIVLVDIDHFKRINDTHGHEAGDKMLKAVGQFLQSRMREEDLACRYGGEEFVFVLPEASLEATRQRAERLREEVKGLRVQHRGRDLESVSVSLGVAVFPEHGATGAALLRAADHALYRAKAEGRDRLVVGHLVD
jgi:diguanylate cyclase (GGDEF)-like protein/PAS domain S-box-containing protein